MNLDHFINHLSNNKTVVTGLVRGISDEQAHWRPSPADWSVLEVMGHLYDEEREDFRARVQLTLNDPAKVWPAIEPGKWVIDRKYNERNPKQVLEHWLRERDESLKWLSSLKSPVIHWNNAHIHPSGISLSAADLLVAWLAHDYLHIRQLNELHYLYLKHTTAPANIGYAGDW